MKFNMNLRFTLCILLLPFFILISDSSKAQDKLKARDINYNLYYIQNPSGGNVAFLITRKGVIVIDSDSSIANAKDIISAIKSVTKKPIKYLILTHFHGDQANGVAAFPSDVQIIAHKNTALNYETFYQEKLNLHIDSIVPEQLQSIKTKMDSMRNKNSLYYEKLENNYADKLEYLDELKRTKFKTPDIIFEDFYRLKVADERIILEYPGPCHTNDNILVKFSNHNVIHTGDLVFNGRFPCMTPEHGVDIINWIQTLEDIYSENIIDVIHSQGRISSKSSINKQIRYFKTLTAKINDLSNEGYSLSDIKKQISVLDFKLTGNESQLPINIEVIYSVGSKNTKWWKF